MAKTIATITNLIDEQLELHAEATALIYGARRYSYAELSELGARTAAGLAELGVGLGDRVALWLPNTPAYLGFLLGCARLGAIATSVNTRFRATEVADIIARSGAKVLVMWPGFRQIDFPAILGEAAAEDLRRLEALVLYDEGQAADDLPANVSHCRMVSHAELIDRAPYGEDHAAPELGSNMFTTSGTTKAPKFVLHTQQSVADHARTVAREFGYSESQGGLLLGVPFCGVFGFTQAMASLASGRPSVVMSAFDAAECVAMMHEHRVEHTDATDDMVQAMMAQPGGIEALARIKFIGTAAFGTDFDAFSRRAEDCGITLMGLYGMSEVQALFARRDETLPFDERLTAGGTLIDERAAVRVRDPDSGELLPFGEAGELELKGPSMMKEYFADPAATAEALSEDGYIRTGDLGYQQDERSFVYLQRLGDVLRLGGFLVSPAEIESRLQSHDSVEGAQVVGVASAAGTRPVGFITLAAGAAFDEEALRGHCLAGLAKFKAPARIYQIAEFPTTKSANGTKIQRAKLRQMAEQRLHAGDA